MIGCHAQAKHTDIIIDKTELDDARWFTRAEVRQAISGSANASFQAPPPTAIARTLMEHWLGLEAAQTHP
jgi:NAD+ diphosphatase